MNTAKKKTNTRKEKTSSKRKPFAIVIPTYNEAHNIQMLIPILRKKYANAHIFVVDDNSPDKTWKVVEAFAKHDPYVHLIFQKAKQGLGRAYVKGFQRALRVNPEFIVQMDADFSHDPKYIKDMLRAIKHYDVVIGSRYMRGVNAYEWGLHRIVGSYLWNVYIKFITHTKINDATSGYRCYRGEVVRAINFKQIRSKGYSFQTEMTYVVGALGFKMREWPIIFYGRKTGYSKMNASVLIEAILRSLSYRFMRVKKKNS